MWNSIFFVSNYRYFFALLNAVEYYFRDYHYFAGLFCILIEFIAWSKGFHWQNYGMSSSSIGKTNILKIFLCKYCQRNCKYEKNISELQKWHFLLSSEEIWYMRWLQRQVQFESIFISCIIKYAAYEYRKWMGNYHGVNIKWIAKHVTSMQIIHKAIDTSANINSKHMNFMLRD